MKNILFITVFSMFCGIGTFAQSGKILTYESSGPALRLDYPDTWTNEDDGTGGIILSIDDYTSTVEIQLTPLTGSIESAIAKVESESSLTAVETTFNGYKAYRIGNEPAYAYYVYLNNTEYYIFIMYEPEHTSEVDAILKSIKL